MTPGYMWLRSATPTPTPVMEAGEGGQQAQSLAAVIPTLAGCKAQLTEILSSTALASRGNLSVPGVGWDQVPLPWPRLGCVCLQTAEEHC